MGASRSYRTKVIWQLQKGQVCGYRFALACWYRQGIRGLRAMFGCRGTVRWSFRSCYGSALRTFVSIDVHCRLLCQRRNLCSYPWGACCRMPARWRIGRVREPPLHAIPLDVISCRVQPRCVATSRQVSWDRFPRPVFFFGGLGARN